MGAKTNRVLELLDVVDAADVEGPDADAVVRDSKPHALSGQLVPLEEVLQRGGERLRVAELSADDDPGLELLARHLDQLRNAVVVDPSRGELRAADLEARHPLQALRGRSVLGLTLGRLGLRLVALFAAERELALVEGDALPLRLLLLRPLLLLRLRLLCLLRLRLLCLLRRFVALAAAERELSLVPGHALGGRCLELGFELRLRLWHEEGGDCLRRRRQRGRSRRDRDLSRRRRRRRWGNIGRRLNFVRARHLRRRHERLLGLLLLPAD